MNINRIRGLMAERQMSQQAIADKLDISLSAFHRKLKSGGLKFTLDEIIRMKEVYNLSDSEAAAVFFAEHTNKD